MRLYKSSNGQWAGTQRDAQKNFPRDWSEVDVPTSKADLIAWLNDNQVGATKQAQPVVEHNQFEEYKPVDPSLIDPRRTVGCVGHTRRYDAETAQKQRQCCSTD